MTTGSPRSLLIGRGWKDTKDFGQLVRWQRLSSERSADEVAEGADITAAFLRAIERGDRAPSRDTAAAILDALAIQHTTPSGAEPARADLEITDPRTKERLCLQFKAAHKGDSVSWTLRTPGGALSRAWRAPLAAPEPTEADALLAGIVRQLATADPKTLQEVAALLESRKWVPLQGAKAQAPDNPVRD